jgi:hypothetical protein
VACINSFTMLFCENHLSGDEAHNERTQPWSRYRLKITHTFDQLGVPYSCFYSGLVQYLPRPNALIPMMALHSPLRVMLEVPLVCKRSVLEQE